MKMQTTAKLRRLRISPRKVRLIADMVRGKHVAEALVQLAHNPKHAARPVKKLIESAVANARHNHQMEEASLMIKTIFVDEGKTMFRFMPRAFGRATKIRKRSSHITLVLEGEVDVKKAKAADSKKDNAKSPVKTDDSSVSTDDAKATDKDKKETKKPADDVAKLKKAAAPKGVKKATSKKPKANTRTTNK